MYQGGSHGTALVKLVIENFYENMWINSVFSYKRTAISGTARGIADSSAKCFVVGQECNENYSRVSVTNLDGSVLFTATCRSTVQGYIVVFPQRQWLRESVTVFRYT